MPSKALLPLGEKKVLLWQGSNEGETCGEGEAMPEATKVGQRIERGARWLVPLQVMREVGGGWGLEVAAVHWERRSRHAGQRRRRRVEGEGDKRGMSRICCHRREKAQMVPRYPGARRANSHSLTDKSSRLACCGGGQEVNAVDKRGGSKSSTLGEA